MRPRKHYAQHAGQGQGLKCPQAKWRCLFSAEVDSIPALLSGTGTKSSEVELGGKRRRLDPESQVHGHLDSRLEVGLPIMGSSSPDAEDEQDSASDIGGNQNVAGKDCASWPTPGGGSQIFGSQTNQPGESPLGCRSGYSVAVGLEA